MSAAPKPRRRPAPRSPKAAVRAGDGKRNRKRKVSQGGRRRQAVALSGPGDGGVISDPVALGELVYDFLNKLKNDPHPLAGKTVLFLSQTKGYFEYLGEVANGQGENFSRDVKQMLRDEVLLDLDKTETPAAIAKLIDDGARGRSAIDLLTENPHVPGTREYKARQFLKFNGGVTIDQPRIEQILKISKSRRI